MNHPGRKLLLVLVFFVAVFCVVVLAVHLSRPVAGHVRDEALRAKRSPESFPAADEDYYHDMDGAAALTPDEVKGRNTWIVWTAGNDKMWDALTATSLGTLDLLKTISSRPGLKASR